MKDIMFIGAIVFVAICSYLIMSFVDYVFFQDRKYPLKLRFYWWLIHVGYRRTEMSSRAHRVYNDWYSQQSGGTRA